MKVSDREFADLFRTTSPANIAKRLGVTERHVYNRRKRIEKRTGQVLHTPNASYQKRLPPPEIPGRLHCEVPDGVILVGSDAHFWPGIRTAAFRAFLHFCKELKPKVVVMNGDMIDGASISRHPPIGWEGQPSVQEEIETVQERLGEIEKVAFKAKKYWPLGNHDARFETRLAADVPQYKGVKGLHLRDHFSLWEPCWSVWVNNETVIKHRFKNGAHATHNAALNAGKTMVTGHLHSLKVTPLTDYRGTRFGVDTGTLADPFGPQFEYQEDNPRNHRSGFVVLTYFKSRLLWPEVCHVVEDGVVEFRGRLYNV